MGQILKRIKNVTELLRRRSENENLLQENVKKSCKINHQLLNKGASKERFETVRKDYNSKENN